MNRLPWFLRWLAGSLAAVALLTAALVVKGQGQPERSAYAQVTAAPSVQQSLERLLVTVADADGHLTGMAILVFSGDSLTVLTLDPHIAGDFGGARLSDFYTAGTTATLSAVQHVMEAATGIRVDGVLAMRQLAFAGLLDLVGGVDVVAPRSLLMGTPGERVFISGGTSHQSGTIAARYAAYRGPGEPESVRTERYVQVLRAALEGLPVEQGRVREVMSSLGSMAQSSVPTDDIADLFYAINTANAWPTATIEAVPTVPSDLEMTPGSLWVRVDQVGERGVAAALPGTVHVPQRPVRVLVVGGSAAQRLAVRDTLRAAGLTFLDGGSLEQPPLRTAVTIDLVAQPLDLATLLRTAGLANLDPEIRFLPGAAADAVITLGRDWPLG